MFGFERFKDIYTERRRKHLQETHENPKCKGCVDVVVVCGVRVLVVVVCMEVILSLS